MDHFQDSAQMAMLRRFGFADPELEGADAAALDAVPLNGGADGEGFEGAGNGLTVGAGVGQGGGEHVAREAGEGVDVTDLHAVIPV